MITWIQHQTKGRDTLKKYIQLKIKEIEKAFNYISNDDFVDLLSTIDSEYQKYLKTIKDNIEDIKECLEKD